MINVPELTNYERSVVSEWLYAHDAQWPDNMEAYLRIVALALKTKNPERAIRESKGGKR